MDHRFNSASDPSFGPQTGIWARFPFARLFRDPGGSWRWIACLISALLCMAAPAWSAAAADSNGHRITSFYGVDLDVRKDDQKKNFKGFKPFADIANSWIREDVNMTIVAELDKQRRVLQITAASQVNSHKDCSFMKGIYDAYTARYPSMPSIFDDDYFMVAESLSSDGKAASNARFIAGVCGVAEGKMPMIQLIARLSREETER